MASGRSYLRKKIGKSITWEVWPNFWLVVYMKTCWFLKPPQNTFWNIIESLPLNSPSGIVFPAPNLIKLTIIAQVFANSCAFVVFKIRLRQSQWQKSTGRNHHSWPSIIVIINCPYLTSLKPLQRNLLLHKGMFLCHYLHKLKSRR